MTNDPQLAAPTRIERLFNAAVGWLVRAGVGPSHMRVLEVRGRASGRLFTLPVDLLEHEQGLYLVAPRGRTQWVRNAAASDAVVLRRGARRERYALRALSDAEKPPVLKAYLDRFRGEVGRFFPLPADSPVEAFAPLAARYPAFALTRLPDA
ncbi:MAG TPA: nitroreductase/quinone reductase family protein [Candidatus Dormibacteraeota bacterium]|nr:nitroreductase/quinone reductase family protein [Candidatus Dormibacteraeota bacterium]